MPSPDEPRTDDDDAQNHASELSIRPAEAGDVPQIRRVAARAWKAAYDEILESRTIERALASWYAPDTLESFLTREDVCYFVADVPAAATLQADREQHPETRRRDRELAGYIGGNPASADEREDAVMDLGTIYVDPDRWGEGIGTALLERFETAARRRGYTAVRLQVLADNDVGRGFYRRNGYVEREHRESTVFGEEVTDVVMCRSIAQGSNGTGDES